MYTRVELLTPRKHPAMGAAEYPRADYLASPPPNERAYTFEDVGNAVRIIGDGKAMRVPYANVACLWEAPEEEPVTVVEGSRSRRRA